MELILLTFAVFGLVARFPAVHVVLFLIHALVALRMAWRLVPRQPLSAAFIGAYVVMYFPDPVGLMLGWIPGGAEDGPSILYPSNVLLMVGLDLFILGARRLRITRRDANRMPQFQISHLPVDGCIALCFTICAVTGTALTLGLAALNINVFTAPKTVMSLEGDYSSYYLAANYAFLSLPLVVFLIGLKRPALQPVYLVPVAFFLVFHFMVFRVRSSFVSVAVAYLVAVIARAHLVRLGARMPPGRLGAHIKLFLVASVPLLLFFVVGFKYARHSYMIQDYRITEERVEEAVGTAFSGGDFGHAYYLRRAMALYPQPQPYLLGQSYYRLLFVPVPRMLWPEKPEDTQRIFARALDPKLGRRGTTIPPGVVGDLYINFGSFGVLGMVLWGFFFGMERYRRFSDLLFLAGAGWWLFHVVRGAVTVPLMFALAMWLAALFFQKIIRPITLPPAVGLTLHGPAYRSRESRVQGGAALPAPPTTRVTVSASRRRG